MVGGLIGVNAPTAFKLGIVTIPLQQMEDCLVLVKTGDHVQLKHWVARMAHVSSLKLYFFVVKFNLV